MSGQIENLIKLGKLVDEVRLYENFCGYIDSLIAVEMKVLMQSRDMHEIAAAQGKIDVLNKLKNLREHVTLAREHVNHYKKEQK